MKTRVALLALALTPAVSWGQTFMVAINQAASSVSYTIGVNAPFATTPALPQNAPIPTTSYLIGGAADTPPTTPATRTRPSSSLIGGNFTGNQPVAITSGSISASVSSGGSPPHPAGTFDLALNTAAGTCTISGASLDLLGGSTVPFTVNVSVGFQSFHTNSPTSTFLIPGITVPLTQNATVTNILATQEGAVVGTLTATATPGVYLFSAPVTLTLIITATLNGTAIIIPPQDVEVVLAGTIDAGAATGPVSSNIDIDTQETIPGPTALDALPFPEPIYGGQLLANIVLASQTVSVEADITIAATATRTGHPADFNNDGFINPDDLADFITCFFLDVQFPGFCPAADFNGDGFRDPDDLADFITTFFISR